MAIAPPPSTRSLHPRAARAARTLATALAVAALVTGCGLLGSNDDAEPPATTTRPTTSTTVAPVLRSDPPELLDAGEEPRHALRVTYAEGDEAEITFTSDLAVTQDSTGRTQRLDSPPIAQTLTYTVGSVSDAGAELTIRIDAIVAKGKGTGLDDDEVAALDQELAPLVGLEATGIVTPLGELEDLSFAAPDGLPEGVTAQLDALEEQLPALGPALPSQPVGLGASWRTTSTSRLGGAETETVSTFTVTEIANGTLRYTTSIRTTAPAQDLTLTGLPEGTTARLESSKLQGEATGSMGLDHVALELRTNLNGSQSISLTADDVSTDLTQAITIAYVAATAQA